MTKKYSLDARLFDFFRLIGLKLSRLIVFTELCETIPKAVSSLSQGSLSYVKLSQKQFRV